MISSILYMSAKCALKQLQILYCRVSMAIVGTFDVPVMLSPVFGECSFRISTRTPSALRYFMVFLRPSRTFRNRTSIRPGLFSSKSVTISHSPTIPETILWRNQKIKQNKQTNKQTPWSESASELYRPSDRRLSAKWLPTFAERGCHVVSVTDPYGRILGFLDRSRYFSIK
jgi:hypothetical protein